MLAPKRGDKVKRVSKVFQQSTEKPRPTSKQTTPTKKLHPSIQSAIKSFPHDAFNLVETKVKLALPTAEGKSAPINVYLLCHCVFGCM